MREERERPPGQEAAGDKEMGRYSTRILPHRCSQVKIARKRYPPAWQPFVVVDDFALNPDIDFPIACFERWPWGAS